MLDHPAQLRIQRFQPQEPGGKGLAPLPPYDPATLLSGDPQQSGLSYFEDAALGLFVGVWACTPFTGKMAPWGSDEFIQILEGSVTLDLADGSSEHFGPGDAFVIPRGLVCSWRQEEPILKNYLIFEDPAGQRAADPVAPRPIRLTPQGPSEGLEHSVLQDPALFVGGSSEQWNHTYFTDASGQLTIGLWQASPYERIVVPSPRYELMCLLEGAVTFPDGRGGGETFRAGETLFVPFGTLAGWKNEVPVRKFYCIFKPA